MWVPKDYVAETRDVAAGDPVSVVVPDAGGEGQGEAHALAEPGSTPGPATPEPEKAAPTVIRLWKKPQTSMSFTREQVTAMMQNIATDAARAAVRQASGRLDD
jgi:hypothetical protein